NGGPFAVDFANGRRDEITLSSGMRPKIFGVKFAVGGGTAVQPGAPQPFRVPLWLFKSLYVSYTNHNVGRPGNRRKSKRGAQNYSGFGLKSQTPARKSAQLTLLTKLRLIEARRRSWTPIRSC